MLTLNICLHNIVESALDIKTPYDLSQDQLMSVIEICERTAQDLGVESTVYYFDDGYKSFKTIVASRYLGVPPERLVAAIITELIGAPDRLNENDIKQLFKNGFKIVPHGASHAALAIFDAQGHLVPTPLTPNIYHNSPRGKVASLSSSEVLYQLNESRSKLLEILPTNPVDEFVLPYGLYNNDTLTIARSTYPRRLMTCHSGIDDGQFLSPRHLVTQENIITLENDLRVLTTSFTRLE